jgi:hypothetical protein
MHQSSKKDRLKKGIFPNFQNYFSKGCTGCARKVVTRFWPISRPEFEIVYNEFINRKPLEVVFELGKG